MTMRIAAIVASLSVACGCTTPSAQPQPAGLFAQATSICAILANPKQYIGKLILVRGNLTQNPHRMEFWDDGCDRGFLPVHEEPTPQDRKLQSKLGAYMKQSKLRPPEVPVIYSGTFTDNSPSLVCDGLCSKFTLEGAKLVSVG